MSSDSKTDSGTPKNTVEWEGPNLILSWLQGSTTGILHLVSLRQINDRDLYAHFMFIFLNSLEFHEGQRLYCIYRMNISILIYIDWSAHNHLAWGGSAQAIFAWS